MSDHLTLPDDRGAFTFLISDPTEELLRFVIGSHIDMVVMGVMSRALKHLFVGSVADGMFRRCPVPIISYREEILADVCGNGWKSILTAIR